MAKITQERKEELVDTAADLFFETIGQAIHQDFAIKNKQEFEVVRDALVNYINAMEYDKEEFG